MKIKAPANSSGILLNGFFFAVKEPGYIEVPDDTPQLGACLDVLKTHGFVGPFIEPERPQRERLSAKR